MTCWRGSPKSENPPGFSRQPYRSYSLLSFDGQKFTSF
jgi:hypothetical protein